MSCNSYDSDESIRSDIGDVYRIEAVMYDYPMGRTANIPNRWHVKTHNKECFINTYLEFFVSVVFRNMKWKFFVPSKYNPKPINKFIVDIYELWNNQFNICDNDDYPSLTSDIMYWCIDKYEHKGYIEYEGDNYPFHEEHINRDTDSCYDVIHQIRKIYDNLKDEFQLEDEIYEFIQKNFYQSDLWHYKKHKLGYFKYAINKKLKPCQIYYTKLQQYFQEN